MKMCENRYLSQAKEEKQEFEDRPEYRKFSEGKYGAFHFIVCLSDLFILPRDDFEYCHFGACLDLPICF